VRTGSAWRYMPHDLPPWEAVYQQTRRWLEAGVLEEMVHDLRVLFLRLSEGRAPDPTATILDSRTLQSTPESGSRGGYDGAKRKKGTKVHAAVDTPGHLLASHVTPADEQEREHVGELAETVQEATGESVELAYVDQGYTGERPATDAETHGMRLEVVKHEEAKRGFVLTTAPPLWWSGISHGHHDFDGRRRITRGCPPLWRVCTLSPSLAPSSSRRPASSAWVHNTL
jgi:transposase